MSNGREFIKKLVFELYFCTFVIMKYNRVKSKLSQLLKYGFLKQKLQEPFLSIRDILGFAPRNLDLYELALRHGSMSLKSADGEPINNERLEFLGDSILSAIVSDLLYRKFGSAREGELTNIRSKLVNRETMNRLGVQIGLNKLVIAERQASKDKKSSIYGNALEAFLGAVYLDVGYEQCLEFVKHKLMPLYNELNMTIEENMNYKSALLEWCQRRYLTVSFELIDETVDLRNNHKFESMVVIQNVSITSGSGASKKESHQQAARLALEKLDEDSALVSELMEKQNEK